MELDNSTLTMIIFILFLFQIVTISFSIWSHIKIRNKRGPTGPMGPRGPRGISS